ncbi:hypothetical protein KKG61_01665 [bacterium]|nr:hypothetical protein [bacterium]MBU1598807.1 hypothetical protein [bacterium]MBU2461967.1 hypothetical protein [bacterium]
MSAKVKSVKEVYQMASVLFKSGVEDLQKEGLRLYLTRQLQRLKAERFSIAKKYGISTSEEMEELYKKKELSEKDSWEDFFELDNIEAEIEEAEKTLAVL